jgi:hypothetical protein
MCLTTEARELEAKRSLERNQADMDFANVLYEIAKVEDAMADEEVSQKTYDALAKVHDHLIVQHNAFLSQIESLRD